MDILDLLKIDKVNNTVRMCELPDGTKAASVYDILSFILDTEKVPYKVYTDAKKLSPELESEKYISQYRFPGEKQRLTPVATVQGIVKIIMVLPGKKAASFRYKISGLLVRFIGGDESLIDEIRANGEKARELDLLSIREKEAIADRVNAENEIARIMNMRKNFGLCDTDIL